VHFLYILLLYGSCKNIVISRMYKKLHTKEKSLFENSLSAKGSFLGCVPERVIMLTKDVYDIQVKNRKTPYFRREFFCRAYHYFWDDILLKTSLVVCSINYLLFVLWLSKKETYFKKRMFLKNSIQLNTLPLWLKMKHKIYFSS